MKDQESYDVQGVTIHSVEVRQTSPDTATANVHVTFDDDTGPRDFSVDWRLREIYGQWKLDEET